ncbi:MAG TPA: UvrD-helicase domain-containing protein [Mariniphaga sp.]|nr:UvrD-helicase domain-containing protein [Mariniphaga sp.]
MELTEEQKKIIESTGNIKINAVAGSGKTTTVIEYAASRPKTSRILYLAFNRSVRLEAIRKFAERGITNVRVETAHSLAFKHVVRQNNYTVKRTDYKPYEVAKLLGLQGNGEKHTEYVVAKHILKFISFFCNSDSTCVHELNYLETIHDSKARTFVTTLYGYIEQQSRILLKKMDKGEIDVTHDFYLKKFQLSNPQLRFDVILFDEGQDASPAMLDVFFKQKAVKVIVGDTHQQIYGWRYAVNSLEKADFKDYYLSTSFRFNQDIANLAMDALKLKEIIGTTMPFSIKGKGIPGEIKSKAVIARTNLGLLLKAIEYVMEKKKVRSIYFEGNINSYTYADDGASLYDVLNLYNKNRKLIKDKLILEMKDMDELEDYIKKTEDVQLGMMVEIVKEYGNEIPKIIEAIKEKHIKDDTKENAEMIFSTVHRSKGMEYDAIQLARDFITGEELKKQMATTREENHNRAQLNEEINLLYVAITRTKSSIHIPETIVPGKFPMSRQIHVMRVEVEKKPEKVIHAETVDKPGSISIHAEDDVINNYKLKEKAGKVKEAYQRWTTELDDELTVMYCEGVTVKDIAKHFGRSRGAIRSRIKKLELEELYG